jgi:hypothetical protein
MRTITLNNQSPEAKYGKYTKCMNSIWHDSKGDFSPVGSRPELESRERREAECERKYGGR